MRGSFCGVLALVAVVGLALPATSQAGRRTATVEMPHLQVARLPYTAEYKISQVRTLADGSTITHESTEVIAFDSEGRRMTATTTVPDSADQTPRTHVNVFDPVARTTSSWSVPGQRATVMNMPAIGAAHSSCAAATTAAAPAHIAPTPEVPRERPVVEDLGTETIAGIEARGRRTVTTTPAGAIGNNEPLVRTSEMWTAVAPGLRGLVASQVSDDPQSGKTDKELVNLNQSEPDPSVFEPPAEYEIVSKDAPVPICAGSEKVEQPMAPIAPPPPPPEQ